MFSNAVPAAILFILIVLYFPSSPSIPPSLSSHQERLDFTAGFKEVMKSGACWLVAVGCSIPQGISVAWTAMMVINLTEAEKINVEKSHDLKLIGFKANFSKGKSEDLIFNGR